MSRRRFQFRLSTLLWITLAVGCWFGGAAAWPWLVKNWSVLFVASMPVGTWLAAFLIQRKLCRPYRDDP